MATRGVSRFRFGTLFVLLAALAAPRFSAAHTTQGGTWSINGVDTFESQYDLSHKLEGGEQEAHKHLRNLVDLFLTAGNYNFGATLAVLNFYPAHPTVDPGWQGGIRKIFGEYRTTDLSFTVGDFYSALGRGLALAVLKDDAILLDDTITGGRMTFKTGPIKFSALGGYVEDEVTAETDWVTGAEGMGDWQGWELGARYSYVTDKNEIFLDGSIHTATASAKKTLFGGNLDLYGEAGFMTNTDRETFGNGHAVYANGSFRATDSWNVLLEYKDYYLFNNKYNNPPLADEEDQVNDLEDVRGFRVRNDFASSRLGATFVATAGVFEKILKDSTGYQIAMSGEKQDLFGKVFLNVAFTYRWDLFDIRQLGVESTVPFSDRNSVEFHAMLRKESSDVGNLSEDEITAGFARSAVFSVYYLFQYSSREVIGSHYFHGGEVNIFLREDLDLNFFGGESKGGKVCSGGVCRWEPPFKGFKVKAIYRF